MSKEKRAQRKELRREKRRKNKKKRMKTLLIIALILAAVCIVVRTVINIATGSFLMGFKIRNKSLTAFTYSSGGDMRGSHDMESVRLEADGSVVLSFAESEWYAEDPRVSEYRVSADALKEIESVFRKYHMVRWKNKAFQKVFVADGASYSYYFSFDGDSAGFSSQMYPLSYQKKLRELHDIIDKYRESGTLLPGLVMKEREDEDYLDVMRPADGNIAVEVFSYCENTLKYRVMNGTENEIEQTNYYELFDPAGELICKNESKYIYDRTVYPNRSEESSIRLNDRLAAGIYTLMTGDLECSFEIR